MNYQSSNTKTVYDIDFSSKMQICPECSPSRKKSKRKDLKFYSDTNRAYCHHCNTTFFEFKPYQKGKQYTIPEWKNETKLTDKAVKYMTSRMISQNTLNKMGIYSAIEWMPQFQKKIETICFPFFQDNKLINIKYRGPKKSFKLFSGAELIWYNFDAIKKNNKLIICEGEIDALTWIENGFDNVISIPNGASNNLSYLDSSIELFENIDTIYLSTDIDSKGVILRDELIRRLGSEKCYIINFKQYKDANEYYCENVSEFKQLIHDAIKVPTSGIIRISDIFSDILDLYENGDKKGLGIQSDIDDFLLWETGRLAVVTGTPQSGKSEFIDFIISKLNLLHGWKVGLFTPENYPLQQHYKKIHSKFSGREFNKRTDTTDFYNIHNKIKDDFIYIMDENDSSPDFVLEKAALLVKNDGIKVLVIDPYNRIEHKYENISETQYISKFLDKLTDFAKFNRVLVILVAHPKKMQKGEVPNLYDISGSANFYNKADYGFVVHRPTNSETGVMGNIVQIFIYKVKFKHLGQQGTLELNYNYNNGRYESKIDTVDKWNNSNWLTQERTEQIDDIEPNFNTLVESTEMPF
jgi:twinkle protein